MAWMDDEELRAKVEAMLREGTHTKNISSVTGLTRGQILGFSYRSRIGLKSIQREKRANQRVGGVPKVFKPRKPKPVAYRFKSNIIPFQPVMYRHKGSDKPISILDLKLTTCKWFLGHGLYCGKGVLEKNGKLSSWCEDHYNRVFQCLPSNRSRSRGSRRFG